MQLRFAEELSRRGRAYFTISGSPSERLAAAEGLIANRLGLRP